MNIINGCAGRILSDVYSLIPSIRGSEYQDKILKVVKNIFSFSLENLAFLASNLSKSFFGAVVLSGSSAASVEIFREYGSLTMITGSISTAVVAMAVIFGGSLLANAVTRSIYRVYEILTKKELPGLQEEIRKLNGKIQEKEDRIRDNQDFIDAYNEREKLNATPARQDYEDRLEARGRTLKPMSHEYYTRAKAELEGTDGSPSLQTLKRRLEVQRDGLQEKCENLEEKDMSKKLSYIGEQISEKVSETANETLKYLKASKWQLGALTLMGAGLYGVGRAWLSNEVSYLGLSILSITGSAVMMQTSFTLALSYLSKLITILLLANLILLKAGFIA